MVIVDTSVWITFLRNGHNQLEKLQLIFTLFEKYRILQNAVISVHIL